MAKQELSIRDPKHSLFAQHYLDPMKKTFGNVKGSALAAGFAENYADQLSAKNPKWLQETVQRVIPSEVDLIAGMKRETTYGLKEGEKDTAMAAQTRLKALELIGKTRKVDAFADSRQAPTFTGDIQITFGAQPPRKIIEAKPL